MKLADEFIQNSNIKSINYNLIPKENKLVFNVERQELSKAVQAYNKVYVNNALTSVPKKEINVSFDEFKEATPTIDLYGGQLITSYNSQNVLKGFTLGFCGYTGGVAAILTCGHNRSFGDIIQNSTASAAIGTISKVQFTSGQSGDYGVAKVTNSNYSITNNVTSGSSSYGITGSMSAPSGTLVYRYGQSSGLEALKIDETNYSVNYDTIGVTVNGMYTSKHVSGNSNIGGDSGGPIYTTNSAGKWVAIGTTSGVRGSAEQDAYRVYISPISLVSGFTLKTN